MGSMVTREVMTKSLVILTFHSGVTRNVRKNLLEITYLPESEIFGVNATEHAVLALVLDELF